MRHLLIGSLTLNVSLNFVVEMQVLKGSDHDYSDFQLEQNGSLVPTLFPVQLSKLTEFFGLKMFSSPKLPRFLSNYYY
jgi:hypothetical protein